MYNIESKLWFTLKVINLGKLLNMTTTLGNVVKKNSLEIFFFYFANVINICRCVLLGWDKRATGQDQNQQFTFIWRTQTLLWWPWHIGISNGADKSLGEASESHLCSSREPFPQCGGQGTTCLLITMLPFHRAPGIPLCPSPDWYTSKVDATQKNCIFCKLLIM